MNAKPEMSSFETDPPTDPEEPKSDSGYPEMLDPETINEVEPEKPKVDGFREFLD